ncbi:MAG: heavy-metal-associated domain-containing protein [Anaerolineales bacterium]
METITIEIPTMYGDHHVLEVRKILLAIPGVKEIYASSCFGIVQVEYDPTETNDLQIKMKLDEAGYLGEWTIPVEYTKLEIQQEKPQYFRHTEVFETTKSVVSFAQNVSYSGRPLWPCPGMGPIREKMEE